AWIGSRLGFSKPAKSAKLSWTVEIEPGVAAPLALTIDAGRLSAGRYQVVVRARDPAAAAVVSATREFLVIEGAGSARP
ncbi:MAG TPA: hypothetical protein VF021_10880, partial [Longimicrobiales bacterium]